MLFGSVIGGIMPYKMPSYRSSNIFVTLVFWRLRNHTFDGHISGLEQDRDNLKPLLPTKSPMPYRLVPFASRSRDHTTSGLAFLSFQSHKKRRKRGMVTSTVVGQVPGRGSKGARTGGHGVTGVQYSLLRHLYRCCLAA